MDVKVTTGWMRTNIWDVGGCGWKAVGFASGGEDEEAEGTGALGRFCGTGARWAELRRGLVVDALGFYTTATEALTKTKGV